MAKGEISVDVFNTEKVAETLLRVMPLLRDAVVRGDVSNGWAAETMGWPLMKWREYMRQQRSAIACCHVQVDRAALHAELEAAARKIAVAWSICAWEVTPEMIVDLCKVVGRLDALDKERGDDER